MLRFLDRRLFRIALAVSIVGVLGYIATTRLLYRTSIEAVLNAPRVTLVAPVDGTVDAVFAPTGSAVAAGAPVVQLGRSPWSSGIGQEAGARAFILRERVRAVEAELVTLGALRDSLGARLAAFREATLARLAGDTLAADARLRQAERQLARGRSLLAFEGATEADLDRLEADVADARADRVRLRAAWRAARAGVVMDPGGQDVPYSQQRLDEVGLRLADLAAERAALDAELATLVGGDPAADVPATGTLPIRAPASGVVWSLAVSPGEPVLRGAPIATLLDCSRLFFEASVSPRQQDRITPGAAVRVRFAGSRRLHPARVAFVRGGGLRETDDDAARLQLTQRRGDARVVVDVRAEDVAATPGNFCQVGRSAKVIFGGPSAPWEPVLAWWERRRGAGDPSASAEVATAAGSRPEPAPGTPRPRR